MLRQSLIVFGFLLLGPIHAAAEPSKLRVTLQLPVSSHLGTNLAHFKDEVEHQSRGAVAVEIYDNSQLFRDDQAVDAVASGAVEMATVTYQQLTGKVPSLGVFEQPFLFNTEALVRAAVQPDSEIRQLLDQAVLDATGIRVLWWQSNGSSVFFSNTRDVKRPDGIHGQKIRVFGENMASFTRYCGGAPFLISSAKQVQAIKDGTVDMIMTGISGVQGRELWKVTNTITRTEHAALEFLVIINEKAWQAMGPQRQKVVKDASSKAEQALRNQMAGIEAEAYAFAQEKGMTVHELGPNEVFEWRACSASLLDDFMKEAGELAPQLMAAYGRLRMQPCCNAGPGGVFSLR